MENTKKGMPMFLAAAITWFGYHCGAGFSSGRQVWLYANRYGRYGILSCVIAWLITCSFIYLVAEYSRLIKAKSYRDLCGGIYNVNNPAFDKGMLVVWDIMILLTAIIGGGGCVAGCGTLARDALGLPYIVGCIGFIVIMFFIVCFGSDVLVRLSKIGIPLIIIFFTICIVGILSNFGRMVEVMSSSISDPVIEDFSIKKVLIAGGTYGVTQASFFQAACVMAAKFRSKKESRQFAIMGFLLNCGAMLISYFCIMAYYPEIGEAGLPTLKVVQGFSGMGGKLLLIGYYVVLVLAYITTAGAVLGANVARYTPLLIKKIPNEQVCRIIILITILGLTAVLSQLGLDGVLTKGNAFNATLRTPIWVIPIFILAPFAIKKAEAANKETN